MWPCHQSWCVIDHDEAITASFDEHGHIRTASLHYSTKSSWAKQMITILGPSLSKRRWNVYPSSYHSHFDVVGLRRWPLRVNAGQTKQVRGPFVKMTVPCCFNHITAIFDELGCATLQRGTNGNGWCVFGWNKKLDAGAQCCVALKVVVICVACHITASFDERHGTYVTHRRILPNPHCSSLN